MLKLVTINKLEIEKEKWTPKYSYILKKLENSPNSILLREFLEKGPINGIDVRDYTEKGKNYIRISDMKRFFLSYSDIKKVEISGIPQKIRLKQNDILFSRKGTPGISLIVTEEDIDDLIGTEAILLRIKEESDPYYLIAFLNSKVFYEQVLNNLSGAVSPGINHPTLKKLKILYDEILIEKVSGKVKKSIVLQNQANIIIKQAQSLLYKKLDIDFSKIAIEKYYSVNLSSFSKVDLWTPAYSYPFYINILKIIQNKFPTIPIREIAIVKKGDEVGSINYNKYLDKKNSDIPFIRTSDLVNYEVDQFPDYYIPDEIYQELKQDIKAGDILFTNDGKIGLAAMLTSQDKIILQSHVKRLRLKKEAIEKYNFTQEFLFLILTLKEIAIYQAERYTVIQSTIPTISNYILDFEIPILDKDSIEEITKLVKQAFKLKEEKKILLNEVRELIDNYFEI
ncbi:MAG: hypothetical protein HPY60_09635 [Candidatus Methanofastidiosum sp.]|nr:hypothetical protein [Methanofastidiosum sp.]